MPRLWGYCYPKLSGIAPVTVQFTDQSTNAPTSWSWSLGDGGMTVCTMNVRG